MFQIVTGLEITVSFLPPCVDLDLKATFTAIRAQRPLSHYSGMAPRARVVSNSSSTSTPSRPPESDIEILYNTAVQSFVRRDHGKTQAALSRLLAHAESLGESKRKWYNLEVDSTREEDEGEEWKVKILKLVISADASLYTDPPANLDSIPPHLAALLPPASPHILLQHIQSICVESLSASDLLPPAIISTLLLASLKLKPSPPALDFAHSLAETWIAGLPDTFMRSISTNNKSSTQAQIKKRIEGSREGYLKVIELFVGEVLAREGEFEMARAFLDGEGVMSSKRKEDLYRHLRSTESRMASTTSPSNSGILPAQSPSASLVLPTATPSGQSSRSRSSTTSSSSSDRTARPNYLGVNGLKAKPVSNGTVKGKEKESEVEAISVDSNSTFHVPDKIYVNPSNPNKSPTPSRRPLASQVQRNFTNLLELIPSSIRRRLLSSWALRLILPVPLITLFLMVWSIRRRRNRRSTATLVGDATQALIAEGSVSIVQEKLRRARALGVRAWFGFWLRWWWKKAVGVWEMGTTITYV